jgi:hypothetical protein
MGKIYHDNKMFNTYVFNIIENVLDDDFIDMVWEVIYDSICDRNSIG